MENVDNMALFIFFIKDEGQSQSGQREWLSLI